MLAEREFRLFALQRLALVDAAAFPTGLVSLGAHRLLAAEVLSGRRVNGRAVQYPVMSASLPRSGAGVRVEHPSAVTVAFYAVVWMAAAMWLLAMRRAVASSQDGLLTQPHEHFA